MLLLPCGYPLLSLLRLIRIRATRGETGVRFPSTRYQYKLRSPAIVNSLIPRLKRLGFPSRRMVRISCGMNFNRESAGSLERQGF